MRTLAGVTGTLALLSTVGLILSVPALTDISHGEPDLTMEWWIVRITGLVLVAFIANALVLVNRILRSGVPGEN
jgi:hypothetical protein